MQAFAEGTSVLVAVQRPRDGVEVDRFETPVASGGFSVTRTTIVDPRANHFIDALVDVDADTRCGPGRDSMFRVDVSIDEELRLATAVVDGEAVVDRQGCLSFELSSDVTGDHCVGCHDLQAVCDEWGTPNADVDGDGDTDTDDLLTVLAEWGLGCTDPPTQLDGCDDSCPG